jgi:hypothetical protein
VKVKNKGEMLVNVDILSERVSLFFQLSFANAMKSTNKLVVPTTPARAAGIAQVARISQLAPIGPARKL